MIKNSFWKMPLMLAVFGLAFALAGCGGSSNDPTDVNLFVGTWRGYIANIGYYYLTIRPDGTWDEDGDSRNGTYVRTSSTTATVRSVSGPGHYSYSTWELGNNNTLTWIFGGGNTEIFTRQ